MFSFSDIPPHAIVWQYNTECVCHILLSEGHRLLNKVLVFHIFFILCVWIFFPVCLYVYHIGSLEPWNWGCWLFCHHVALGAELRSFVRATNAFNC